MVGLVLFTVFKQFDRPQQATDAVSYTQFMQDAKSGRIKKVVVHQSGILDVTTSEGRRFNLTSPGDLWMVGDLVKDGVEVVGAPRQEQSFLTQIFISWFPMLLLIGVWVYFMRQMQGGGRGGAFSFGKSKARLLDESSNNVTFADVAGCDEAKEDVKELVDFLKDPQKFQKLGGRIPRGVLLVGPPGTGKTLLAKSIAGEAKVPFFTISGSDFVEMFVGVGASRVRDMFENAKKHAPCIIFIDEIDAVGRHRGAGLGGGNDEREQTLNQLLVEMDGFEANEGVIIVAATNRKDVLDPALLRPGRFDRTIHVSNPDIKGREKILSVHARKVPLGPDVDLRTIARGSPGFSGADLANLVNEAALLAARIGRRFVSMDDFESAKDKVMMGAERRSMVMSQEDKEMTAYHEAGHAIVGIKLPKCDPVYKATIMPRGAALGMVMSLPEMDRHSWHKDQMKDRIAMGMAGKAAEIKKWGEDRVSSGASGDIQNVSSVARAMVMRWGMSDKIGNIDYGEAHSGYEGNTGGFSVSAETKRMIEDEVKAIVDEGFARAKQILDENEKEFEYLAQGLLEYETLTGDQIRKVMAGEKLTDADDEGTPPEASGGGTPSVASIPKTRKSRAPKPDAEPSPL